MARRTASFHHNLQEGENKVFHREHRSKRGREKNAAGERVQKIIAKEKIEKIEKKWKRYGMDE